MSLKPEPAWNRLLKLLRLPADESQDMPLWLTDASFDVLKDNFGFAEKSIGVASAEGWHEVYGWNDQRQDAAFELLGRAEGSESNPTHCKCRHVVNHVSTNKPFIGGSRRHGPGFRELLRRWRQP